MLFSLSLADNECVHVRAGTSRFVAVAGLRAILPHHVVACKSVCILVQCSISPPRDTAPVCVPSSCCTALQSPSPSGHSGSAQGFLGIFPNKPSWKFQPPIGSITSSHMMPTGHRHARNFADEATRSYRPARPTGRSGSAQRPGQPYTLSVTGGRG